MLTAYIAAGRDQNDVLVRMSIAIDILIIRSMISRDNLSMITGTEIV